MFRFGIFLLFLFSANAMANNPIVSLVPYGEIAYCGIRADGTVKCWGLDMSPSHNSAIDSLALDSTFKCWTSAGKIACEGSNTFGESSPPKISDALYVKMGGGSYCAHAMRATKEVVYWGWCTSQIPEELNHDIDQIDGGCIISGETLKCWSAPFPPPEDIGPVIQVTSGSNHSCVIKTDRTVRCWGDDHYRKLDVPADLKNVRQISAGEDHTCALSGDKIVCWGSGRSKPPENLKGIVQLTSVQRTSNSRDTSCALTTEGKFYCWGDPTVPGFSPEDFTTGYPEIYSSEDLRVECFIKNETARCNGRTADFLQFFEPIPNVKQVAAGKLHLCILHTDGSVECRRHPDHFGEVPADLGRVQKIAATQELACAIRKDKTVKCWGRGPRLLDLLPDQISDVLDFALSGDSLCVLKSDRHTVQCWGTGIASPPEDLANVKQLQLTLMSDLPGGCALLDSGKVRCWGHDRYQHPPADLPPLDELIINPNAETACGITKDRTAVCWGREKVGVPSLTNVKALKIELWSAGVSLWVEDEKSLSHYHLNMTYRPRSPTFTWWKDY